LPSFSLQPFRLFDRTLSPLPLLPVVLGLPRDALSLDLVLSQVPLLLLARLLHLEHVLGHFAAGSLDDLRDAAKQGCVFLGKKGDSFSRPASPARSTNPVDVARCRRWEVVIDDHVDALEVDAAAKQFGTDLTGNNKRRFEPAVPRKGLIQILSNPINLCRVCEFYCFTVCRQLIKRSYIKDNL